MRDLKKALIKGEVDEPIIPYLEVINSKDELYTTSSCYGRITVDSVPLLDNKREHYWIAKWHRKITHEELKEALEKGYEKITYIKQEPFILHIGVKDIETANKLLHIARDMLGLKRSGIMHLQPRIMVEILGLDFISVPAKSDSTYMINLQTLDLLVEILNKKFERNEERLKNFIKLIDENI